MALPIQRVIDGALYWATVDIADAGWAKEAFGLSAALEMFDVLVRRLPIGQARHLIRLLSGEEPTSEYVILACHGDEGVILLPELGEMVEASQPIHGHMTAEDVRQVARLEDRVVICTGCGTGNESLAAAFLDAGCSAYVAPTGGPYGHGVALAVTLIFYELSRGRSLRDAAARLSMYDDELAMWRLWERAG